MTFNEINCVKHHPYVSVGVIEEDNPHLEQDKYQGRITSSSPAPWRLKPAMRSFPTRKSAA
jgi:hypothetical protein